MNIQHALKQAQALQTKMAEMQKSLENETVQGQAGGGLVKITATCKGKIIKVEIDPSLLIPAEKEVLEDLIVAAINNAKQDADKKTADAMAGISSSMGLPSNMMNLNGFFGS
jgi:hypothetical protein